MLICRLKKKQKLQTTSNYALRIEISINVKHEMSWAFRDSHDVGLGDAVTQKAGRPKLNQEPLLKHKS